MSDAKQPNPAFVTMFVEMIKTLRVAGWTQRRLCAELGYDESWLSKIKHAGQGMDLTVLIRICELTRIPPEKLLAGYPFPHKAESDEDRIAKKLHELLPEEIRQKLIALENKKP